MIRALVVDDEDLPRLQLRNMLSKYLDLDVAEASDGVEALERIQEIRPDVVFLDIEMPGLTGFEVLQNLSGTPLIVFATAYDEYAIKAFEANAIDYLLKPIQPARLTQTLHRIRAALQDRPATYEAGLRKALLDVRRGPPTRIAVRKNKRIILLPLRSVLWAGVEDRLVFLHTANERHLTDKTIGDLEEMLKKTGFFRVNRSDLVNLEYVRELAPWSSGTFRLTLTNGAELSVSRDRVRQLKSIIGL
ncbi:MAG: LytR/AlgR family response regulator transcription factor [Bryobacteraceae bacterium]